MEDSVSYLESCFCVVSERADVSSSSYSRNRLKEGANINRSLVALGNVIQALG